MRNLLIRICDALLCVLLLRRAILVEVVELAAGEHVVVGPLAVCFLTTSGRALRAESPKPGLRMKQYEFRREKLRGLCGLFKTIFTASGEQRVALKPRAS